MIPTKPDEHKLIDFTAEHLARMKALDEKFKAMDFKTATEADIVTLFPSWAQEKYALRNVSRKQISNAVNIEHLTLKTPFGDKVLIKDSPLILEAGRRACLFGQNSTGKTLLFTNISEGKIKDFPKHIHVHHCRELEAHELNDTVLEAVINSHPLRRILLRVFDKIKELQADEKTTAEEKKNLTARMEFIQQNLNSIRSADAEDRASKMLRVLGFDEVGQKKLVSALSGGLRMRVALCMAFFVDAELLLLDEPTNHLDFPSVLWLENRLRGYGKSFLCVSHDRELLNNVVTGVILLEDQELKYYNCSFKDFEKKKATEDKKKSDEIDKFLATNRNVDPSSPLGAQKATKKAWSDAYAAKQVALQGKFTFPVATPLENKDNKDPKDIVLIAMKNVRFSYDVKTGHFIFNDPISFDVTASTRCGVMGPNGAGKSTFLKLLTYKLTPTDGTVTHHPSYVLAYFGQHSTAELDLQMTPAEWMQAQFPEEKIGLLRQHLGKTSIVGTVADTRMMRLSFSQRSCVIFSKLTYRCPHLLILDEPTNFLDLESVDSLISACNKYKGALLLVSHNRDFLRKCATHYLSIVPGKFDVFDNMKKAEQATYTFIAEMEEGVKGVGRDALANNPGGAAIHSRQVAGGAKDAKAGEKKAGPMVIGGSSQPAPKPGSAAEKAMLERKAAQAAQAAGGAAPAPAAGAASAAAATFEVKEKVMALWKDGKYYAAVVEKVIAKDKYQVKYTEYGNSAQVPIANIKKIAANAAPAKKK
jgi:ATPase subunit of ABC transporter with duplicated ATPase domains